MKESPEIIGIEGSSFTGKTTLCRRIQEVCKCPLVPEYDYFADKIFPPFPPNNAQAAIDNIDFFVKMEQQRKSYLDSIQRQFSKVVVDRTFLSICGFQYLVQRFGSGAPSVLGYAREKMQEMDSEDRIIKPHKLFILTIDRELFDIRLRMRGRVAVDILNNFENIADYAEFVEQSNQENARASTRVDQTNQNINLQIQSIISSIND